MTKVSAFLRRAENAAENRARNFRRTLHWLRRRRIYPASESRVFRSFQRQLFPWIIAPFGIISRKPAVILTVWDMWADLPVFHNIFNGKKAYLLFLQWTTMESPEAIQEAKARFDRMVKMNPDQKLIMLCNTEKQHELFQSAAIPAIFCNHNALLDEKIYRIIPGTKKKYDAIYNAQINVFKRHYLAKEISNLALISFISPYIMSYYKEVRRTLSNAVWINNPLDENGFVSEGKVAEVINEAGVGLCLSAAEGAMYASVEYLLCGIPVVSTASTGGRNVFFDPDYVRIVGDSPEEVTHGVEQMKNLSTSPDEIRKRTLEKIQPHRGRFIELIQSIYEQEGVQKNFASEWPDVFHNKMFTWQYLKNLEGL